MSSKSDHDNHSNQLNPNNDAYHSSRGVGRHGDDDDDEGDTVVRSRNLVGQNWLRFDKLIRARVEWTVVGLDGRVIAVGADLQAQESALAQHRISDCEDVAINSLCTLEGLAAHRWGCEIAYSEATLNGDLLPIGREYLASVSSGFGQAATRVTPATWPRMARTISYRQQARDAQKALVAAFAGPLQRLNARLDDRPTAKERATLWNLAQTTRELLRAPSRLTRTNVGSLASGMAEQKVFDKAAPGHDELLRLARINEVLVMASNHRAPASSRLTFNERSDAYTEYFDKCIGAEDLARLAIWFSGGEQAVAAVKAAYEGTGPKCERAELGEIEIGYCSRINLFGPFSKLF
jgi:hypothetical protein